MAGKPQNYSLRTTLGIAYNQNINKSNKKKISKSKDKKKDNCEMCFGDTEYRDYYKKFYNIIDGLYCYVNHITIPAKKRYTTIGRWISDRKLYDIKINEFTKCIIIALMTMDSSKGSFISKLINHRFDEIDYEDKLYYILSVSEQIKNIELPSSKDFLVYKFADKLKRNNLDYNDETLLNDEFRKTICKSIDTLMVDFQYEVDRTIQENQVKNNITEQIESIFREFFPRMNINQIPYPSAKKTRLTIGRNLY